MEEQDERRRRKFCEKGQEESEREVGRSERGERRGRGCGCRLALCGTKFALKPTLKSPKVQTG